MTDTTVTFRQVDRDCDQILKNLFEHYLHDMAEWFGFDTNSAGAYAYPTDQVWDRGCEVFLAYSDDIPIGFALVDDAASRVPGSRARDLTEFFVIRRHRRCGVGAAFAHHVWNQRPGPWLVRVYRGNLPAVPFWRAVVDQYTGGRFHEQEQITDTGRTWSYFTFGNGATASVGSSGSENS